MSRPTVQDCPSTWGGGAAPNWTGRESGKRGRVNEGNLWGPLKDRTEQDISGTLCGDEVGAPVKS